MDYTSPSAQFTYDVNNNTFFKKDNRNYINALSINQLNTLGNVSMLDIYLRHGKRRRAIVSRSKGRGGRSN
ncbi:hypothetical protein PRECH8_18210 [Insulibacter thermoxylanivorax]|uniref:Uncharacterized protein n=1 Tax=Insulibacter thermoxylanivorax TaxID=2749268 RepID=A0A916VHP9_9BACL|nr:hypothetical protein PRECH8_18210 [Insulibacter thermoxylanivorax]